MRWTLMWPLDIEMYKFGFYCFSQYFYRDAVKGLGEKYVNSWQFLTSASTKRWSYQVSASSLLGSISIPFAETNWADGKLPLSWTTRMIL